MNTRTLIALAGSIKKWDRIVRSTEAEDNGVSNCPLCELFFGNATCYNCPVYEKTGRRNCGDTPYENWDIHLGNAHNQSSYPQSRIQNCPDCLRFARAERDFLKSLLPKAGVQNLKRRSNG